MYRIVKTFAFEAGHSLVHHDGKCKLPHGHSYTLSVTIEAGELIQDGPKKNMVGDFSDISKIVKPMIEKYFDHRWLNDTLASDSPTAEFIAYWIYRYLKPLIPDLAEIAVHETSTAKAVFSEKK